ncbi:MAG: tyrosine-type recombinase/integrase [Acidobacteriota bacterium]
MMPSLASLLHAFFHDWLVRQRDASPHTVHAYRDTWRLFLRLVAKRRPCAVADLTFVDLTAAEVLTFLDHVEKERHGVIATRNCRLAALRSFFFFVADREPLAAGQCGEVLRIPTKRAPRKTITSLDLEEVSAILVQPDRTTISGQRDHVLLTLLYNTGARIQEALSLTPTAIRLDAPAQIRLVGKGRKERICPLWPETAALIRDMLKRQPHGEHAPIFTNRYGQPLCASGVRFRLRQYVAAAAKQCPRLLEKHVTPHTFRHTAAVQLVAAGVDVTVIQSWLGHAHLDTTFLYAQANVETKRKAIEQVDGDARHMKRARWKRDPEILAWLDAL